MEVKKKSPSKKPLIYLSAIAALLILLAIGFKVLDAWAQRQAEEIRLAGLQYATEQCYSKKYDDSICKNLVAAIESPPARGSDNYIVYVQHSSDIEKFNASMLGSFVDGSPLISEYIQDR